MSTIEPLDEEYLFQGRVIVSETDLKGNIVFANRKFCEISGYTKDELVGKPHNMIRHPDMPRVAFEKMWTTIKDGQIWQGFVKNLRKDGKFYWVETEVLPIKDSNDQITGYVAARRVATRKEIEEATETYRLMKEKE